MLRDPESKTLFWRSSWCGGLGCWWRSSRCRFIVISLHSGGEGALLTALLHSVVRSHQVRKYGPVLRCSESGRRGPSPFQAPRWVPVPIVSTLPECVKGGVKDALRNPYSPECVEQEFSEIR